MTQPARLTSSLLARKGRAIPTAGFTRPGVDPNQRLPASEQSLRPSPGGSPVPLPRTAPAEAHGHAAPMPSGQDDGRRIALTVRLDRERHRRLRVLAARQDSTGQAVILAALDAYFDACGADCACLRQGAGSLRDRARDR